MTSEKLRPIALGVIRNRDRLLLYEGYDPSKHERFYRPLGGGIEFGERGSEALARELREELGAEIAEPRYLGTFENIFTFNGRRGNEIVLVYETAFVDPTFYGREPIDGREADGSAYLAWWKTVADARPLYPEGLAELLRRA